MKGVNGIQMNVHPKFHEIFKELKKQCEIKNKKGISDKRFSLTLAKFFNYDSKAYHTLTNAEVDTNEN